METPLSYQKVITCYLLGNIFITGLAYERESQYENICTSI